MKKTLRLIFKWLIRTVLAFVSTVILYLITAIILGLIPANGDYQPPKSGIEIFVVSSGMHTDFVVPVKTSLIDWEVFFPRSEFEAVQGYTHIAFGWGDKGFYLETPTIADLKFSTVFTALFLPSPTAMHVSYWRGRPSTNSENVRKLVISPNQYQTLIAHVKTNFQQNTNGSYELIRGKNYSTYDNFYEAKGSYSLFQTCNDWTNAGLKNMGIKTALWSPFDRAMLYHLP